MDDEDALLEGLLGWVTAIGGRNMIGLDIKINGKTDSYDQTDEGIEIETYDDFIKSKCHAILLVIDAAYAEIYVKDQALLDRIYGYTQGFDIEVEEKTKENDGRTVMRVW